VQVDEENDCLHHRCEIWVGFQKLDERRGCVDAGEAEPSKEMGAGMEEEDMFAAERKSEQVSTTLRNKVDNHTDELRREVTKASHDREN
jgi:hypothetical protein